MEYTQVKPSELKNYGKLVQGTRYLPEGIHVRDRKPDPSNELFIKEKSKYPPERHVIN